MEAIRRILNALDELESNGKATREWAMAGLYLSLCQRCPQWQNVGCPRIGRNPDIIAQRLVDSSWWCQRWVELHRARSSAD